MDKHGSKYYPASIRMFPKRFRLNFQSEISWTNLRVKFFFCFVWFCFSPFLFSFPSAVEKAGSAVHKNSQNNDSFGQICKIFESWINLQLHNFMPKCFHKSLKTLKNYRFRGLALSKQSCGFSNSSWKSIAVNEK